MVFVPGKPSQPSQTFVNKARAYLCEMLPSGLLPVLRPVFDPLAYFTLISNKEKSYLTLTGVNVIKLFYLTLVMRQSKVDWLTREVLLKWEAPYS
jgi:hypothetical protein